VRRAAKRDTNHALVRDAFLMLGCAVEELDGKIYLAVLDRSTGHVALVDVKTPRQDGGKDRMTPTQQRMVEAGWPIHFARSVDDVTALVLRWRRG
jgi:hypothetical protein